MSLVQQSASLPPGPLQPVRSDHMSLAQQLPRRPVRRHLSRPTGAAHGAPPGRAEPHRRLRRSRRPCSSPATSCSGCGPAIIVALSWSYGAIAWRAVTGRRTSGLLVLTAIVLTGRTVIALVAHSTFFYFLQPIITDGVVAATFLLSLATARPMVARLAGDFYPMDAELSLRPQAAQAVLAPHRDVGGRLPGEGGHDVLGAELALAGHLRAGQEHLDAGVQPLGRGPHHLRCRARGAQGGAARRGASSGPDRLPDRAPIWAPCRDARPDRLAADPARARQPGHPARRAAPGGAGLVGGQPGPPADPRRDVLRRAVRADRGDPRRRPGASSPTGRATPTSG